MNVSTKRFDRRKLVKSSAALGAAAFGLPTIIKKGAAQDTTLSLWGAGDADPAENDTQMAYVAAVEDATGIKLELRNIPFAQFDNVSQAALAAGEGPDLLMVNSVTVGAFVERGYLQATGDLLAASTMVKQED